MEWWQALILGLTQGLTEFLPVSSSGHLTFLQHVMNVDLGDAALLFNLILHMGTLIAVCVIFWKDILELFKKPFKTLMYLVVASIPAAITGFLLDDLIEEHVMAGAYSGVLLGVFFMITAAVLFATELFVKRRKNELPLGWRTTLPMGFAQAIAVLPGISRSGSTIAAGSFAGGKADDVAKFSFLMSIPVILGGFLVELVKGFVKNEFAASVGAAGSQFGWCVAIGLIVSAAAGLFAIKVMLAAIKKANYKWFSAYLVCLAVTCIVLNCCGVF